MPAGFKILPNASGCIQDAQILDPLNFAKRYIAALYDVSMNIQNIDRGTYGSIEQNTLYFKTNTRLPIVPQFKQELVKKLLSDKE